MTSTESPLQPEIDAVYDRCFPVRRDEARSAFETADTEAGVEDEQYTDEEAVRLATTGLWGREFALLYQGRPLEVTDSAGVQKYLKPDGKPDASKVEYNFCLILARVGCPDRQIDRIYHSSKLFGVLEKSRCRNKYKWDNQSWRERRGGRAMNVTYKGRTMAKAREQAERERAGENRKGRRKR